MTNNDTCTQQWPPRPAEIESNDPEVLRAALLRETVARGRAECNAKMQADVVKHALDLLAREPDIHGFFGALTKTVVEEADSRVCGVWLIDEDAERCDLWMAYVKDRLFTPCVPGWERNAEGEPIDEGYPCQTMASHLFGYTAGWTQTVEYLSLIHISEPTRLLSIS